MNYLHIFLGGIVMFKILIAEDDIELCRLFSPVLSKKGYCVKGFSNGQEALNELDRDYFDLIFPIL
jgi:two-component system OmpR family response regulator